jgi:putative transposase
MPQSLSAVFIHLVFSTKDREPWIREPVDTQLYAYGTTVLNNMSCPALAMSGMADHLHALFGLSRVRTIAEVVEELKTSTSKWIKTKGPNFHGFHWQSGYGAFSVSQSNIASVIEYIREQRNITTGVRFKTSCAPCWSGMRFRSTSNTCGIDVVDRMQGAPLGLVGGVERIPRDGRCPRGGAPGYCRLGRWPTAGLSRRSASAITGWAVGPQKGCSGGYCRFAPLAHEGIPANMHPIRLSAFPVGRSGGRIALSHETRL